VSIVVINSLTVPTEMRETLEARFAGRAGQVSGSDGFEWFELLRPLEGTDSYLVYTKWRSSADFQAWMASQSFTQGHAQAAADRPAGQAPAATGSTIWQFEVLQEEGPKT
jgi:heme oxygenase (mycobilin-producing)